MRIIHFSDFHLDHEKLPDFKSIVYNLECILKEINSEKPIDLILFTGDMINQGGESFRDISSAFKGFKKFFIDRLCNSISLDSNRFIFTMGNHDVRRQNDSVPMELGLSRLFEDSTYVKQIINNEDSDNYIKRIIDFKNFEKKYFKKYRPLHYKHSKFCSNFKLLIDDHLVGISALNTAWRCWDSKKDKNNILMGLSQIQNSLEFLAPCELKIAISHHHYSWLHQNESELVQSLLSNHYDMYFYGHIHSPKTEYTISANGKIFEMAAPGILSENINVSDSKYKNGFGVVDYDFKNHEIKVSKYCQQIGTDFIKDRNFGDMGTLTIIAPKSIKLMKSVNSVLSNKAIVNQEINSYIQSPLEYVNEILQGNQVPTFKPDDSYQDVIYEDKIKYIVAITAENPNLFLDPTIGFYMSNCYAVSLIRHVNDFIKKNHQDNPNLIPQLKVCNLSDSDFLKIEDDRQTIIDNLKNKNALTNFEFIRFFIYDKDQGECCNKAVFPSLKASQDLFRTFSFYIQKEELKDSLSEQDWKEEPPKILKLGKEINKWDRLHEINKKILELYNRFCKKDYKAKEVQKDRIEKTIPEFLFVFYEDTIGIHTYLGGVYYRIPKVRVDDDNGNLIKELIKLLTEYVDEDDNKGQLVLRGDQLNNKNTYIICKWSDSSEDGVVKVQL